MLYREIIAVCSQIHTKHINTVCGQNMELCNPGGIYSDHWALIPLSQLRKKKCECLARLYSSTVSTVMAHCNTKFNICIIAHFSINLHRYFWKVSRKDKKYKQIMIIYLLLS